ncbi:flagellar export chaperone FliS [Paenibacillus sp. TRM 82003]|nr:flagellar export chaperone FliS [Paenibacillus sp. TRM 82003]MCI3923382.1 flagellar export chaperone FliS [Paenibacillus sp. TRM 82003]
MMQNQRIKYLETTVKTATSGQLLIMLYDGAIRFGKAAIEALQTGKHQDAHNNLIKVQNIVNEFIITLEFSSPLAESLLQLYEYFNKRLVEANIKKDPEPALEVVQMLSELRETWYEAYKSTLAKSDGIGVRNA